MHIPLNRVLCVEDHVSTGQMMKCLLKIWNYEVVLAQTAADAFRQVQSEYFDLCLLDTSLPDESGIELCKRIREFNRHTPIVFISGHAFEADKKLGLQAGAHAYLTKPLNFDLLKETMAQLIAQAMSESSLGKLEESLTAQDRQN